MDKSATIDDTAEMMTVLEAVGEADIDIVPRVFDQFFAKFPASRPLFLNLQAAAGRMVNETLEAMMGLAENAWRVESTVVNFVDLHRNYDQIPPVQWTCWIDMTVDALIEAGGENTEGERAWRRQADALKAMVDGALIRQS